MKKLAILSSLLIGSALHCSAAVSYLVTLTPVNGAADHYDGDAFADFGIAGELTFVGGVGLESGGTGYTLGTSTLTLAPGVTRYHNASFFASDHPFRVSTHPWALTGGYVINTALTSVPTFTLTGLNTGDIVNIQAIGGINLGRDGFLAVSEGGNPLGGAIVEAGGEVDSNNNPTGKGQFTEVVNFVATSGSTYDMVFNRLETSPGVLQDEANLSGFLITITPAAVPEPSAVLLGGVGLVALSSRRVRRSTKA